VLEIGAGEGAGKVLALADDLAAVVILAVVGHLDPIFLGLADRVLDRERKLAEWCGLKVHPDRVLPDLQVLPLPQHRHDLAQGELDRVVRAHLSRRKCGVSHHELKGVERSRLLVDLDLLDPGDDRIAEPVLEAKEHPIGRVLQTSVGIELLQDERRDLHAVPPRRKARSLYLTRTNPGSGPKKDRVLSFEFRSPARCWMLDPPTHLKKAHRSPRYTQMSFSVWIWVNLGHLWANY